jgi:hypothetical protein
MKPSAKQLRDKHQLTKEIESKITTANIGDISQVEQFFGVLWGHGKPEHELTSLEKEWRQVWEICRKTMLDNGGNQKRLVAQVFSKYTVDYNMQMIQVGSYDNDGRYQLVKHPIILEEQNEKK